MSPSEPAIYIVPSVKYSIETVDNNVSNCIINR